MLVKEKEEQQQQSLGILIMNIIPSIQVNKLFNCFIIFESLLHLEQED